MIHHRAHYDKPELAAPAHKRLNMIQTLSHEARKGAVISPRRHENSQSNASNAQRPHDSQPTFHPQISEGTKQIFEQKRRQGVTTALVEDANRRKNQGKIIR